MAPIRSSNLERGKWRNKCREQLSTHIQTKIGIVIKPSQVRLITGADDSYTWKVLPEKKHLFSKNISDQSIRAYKELYEGVGVTFEAVPVTRTDAVNYLQEVLISQPSQVSFSTRIDEIQEENLKLERELKQWKGQATAESELRWRTDQELDQFKIANQTLEKELQEYAVAVEYFRKNTSKHAQVMHRVLQLMEELKTGTLYDEKGFGEFHPLLCHTVGSPTPLGIGSDILK